MSPEDAIRHIKDRLNIVDIVGRYVRLKQNGSRFSAPCPFHQETKPSFSVNPEKGFFYCFGCHASGDIFEFYSKINGLDFRETLEALAEEAGVRIEWGKAAKTGPDHEDLRSRRLVILKMYEFAANFYISALDGPDGVECREYMLKRGISPEIKKTFGLGWARREWHSLMDALRKSGFDLNLAHEAGLLAKSENGNYYDRFRGRLIFPIKNLSGQTIAFGGRIIAGEEEAKYINSSDTPIYQKKDHLYGLANARQAISTRGSVFLTEGYMDVLTLHQFGYSNSVGVLGTALTVEQIKRLSGFTSSITLLFDGDRAGRKAALRSAEMLMARGLSCKVILQPEGEDIDSLLRTQGKEKFDSLCESAQDGLSFCVDVLQSLAPREGVEWAKNFLANVQIPELASPFASALAQKLHIAEDALRQGIYEKDKAKHCRITGEFQLKHNIRDEQILIFAVRYPDKMDGLREIGADLALSSPEARQFWDLLEQWHEEEIVYHLNDRQKKFWQEKRHGPEAAPLDNCEKEFACLKDELSKFYADSQKASLIAAMAENSCGHNFEAELEYLQALKETMEKNHEQS